MRIYRAGARSGSLGFGSVAGTTLAARANGRKVREIQGFRRAGGPVVSWTAPVRRPSRLAVTAPISIARSPESKSRGSDFTFRKSGACAANVRWRSTAPARTRRGKLSRPPATLPGARAPSSSNAAPRCPFATSPDKARLRPAHVLPIADYLNRPPRRVVLTEMACRARARPAYGRRAGGCCRHQGHRGCKASLRP